MGLADREGTLTGIPSLSQKKSSKQHLKTSFEKLKGSAEHFHIVLNVLRRH